MNVKIQRNIQLSLKARKHRKGRSKVPIHSFLDKFFICEDLVKSINRKIPNKKLKQESRKQYVIGLVTAFEVYFKDTLFSLIKKGKIDISKLIEKKEKIFNFLDVKYIIEKDISIQGLIVYSYNLQRLDIIDDVFSKVFGFNFLDELEKYKWYYKEKDKRHYISVGKNFRKNLTKLLDLRHSFVHETNFKYNLKMKELEYLSGELLIIVTLIKFLIDDFLGSPLRKEDYLTVE